EKEHSILLQGVIDCLCIKDNHAVIIDYKTDNVKQGNEKEHALMYLNQLEIYSKAVEEIMGIKVESKIIYFFKTNSHIDLNLL
ncbi:MAG: PD-(D/E)XK nuclease family protein, partial [Clostridia bacterium]|nr:PD-(D/E)XK nuclease family protein [Clostridia bacterium]